MKFWNKDRNTRESHWTRVDVEWPRLVRGQTAADAKRWCQQHPSTGKFHFYYNDVWYFESAEDATMFMLRWA